MEDELRAEIQALRSKVAELEATLAAVAPKKESAEVFSSAPFPDFPARAEQPLSRVEVERYGRQLIMKEINATGACLEAHRSVGVFCVSL